MIALNMIDIDDEVDQEWSHPRDGFNDDLIEDDD